MITQNTLAESSADALVGLSLCETSKAVDNWSRHGFLACLLITALATENLIPFAVIGVLSLLLVFCQVHQAWQLAYIRPVFARWAQLPDSDMLIAVTSFDASVAKLAASTDTGDYQSLGERIRSAKRALHRQIIFFAGQVVMLVVSLLCSA